MPDFTSIFWLGGLVIAAGAGAAAVWVIHRAFRSPLREERIVTQSITERVKSVGKLIGLEVCAKEIATATTGWGWMPPIVLSQAKLAMIFHFEKQYSVDLAKVRPEDVVELAPSKYRITLPPIDGALRLTDFTPYDIQGARVLGLLDVAPMTAERQRELMKRAQQQAGELFRTSDTRYLIEAQASIERHMRSLLAMFGVEVEIAWLAAAPEVHVTPTPRLVAEAQAA